MDHVGRDAKRAANAVAENVKGHSWLENWVRLGYAARGILYFLIGYLAIELVATGRGKITDQQGALATVASQPYGRILLIVITIGLAGYALWGFYRAIFDPWHKGTDTKGIIARIGYAVSGLIYGLLVVPAYQLVKGAGGSGGGSQTVQHFASGIMTKPWGPWLVGLIGLVILGAGIYEIYFGWKEKFLANLEMFKMNKDQKEWATRSGKFGYIALGVVMGIIGALTVLAAITLDPQKVGGIDQALVTLTRTPYGPILLGLVAFGLMAYAIYSLIGALWFRVKVK